MQLVHATSIQNNKKMSKKCQEPIFPSIEKTENTKLSFSHIQIELADTGFYKGLSQFMTLGSQILNTCLVLWAVFVPVQALTVLDELNVVLLNTFNVYYIYVVSFFLIFCIGLAVIPSTGKIILGKPGEEPTFSNFSWFSMMFSAGMGIGLMVFSTAEPLWHFGGNPEILKGNIEPYSNEAIQSTFRYAFLHYGLHPWGIYVATELSMAYFSHVRNLPLTVRSSLAPIFGRHVNGYSI
ncbi:MAG: BCCT family transporter [Candidatus Nitrotoga sp.]